MTDPLAHTLLAVTTFTDDIHALAASYGGCMGAPVTQLYANMKHYLQENPTVPRR